MEKAESQNKEKLIRKADIILFFALLLLGAVLFMLSLRGSVTGAACIVKVNGEEYGRYSLSRDRTVVIEQNGRRNVLVIRNGEADMKSSTCRNQICVRHAPISKGNESIVCLPNRVTVEITGGKESEVDART